MGIFDKAKDALDSPDQVEGGVDRADDFAEDRTTEADTGQTDSGADMAKDKAGDYLGPRDAAQSMPDPTESGTPPAGSPEPPD